MEKNRVPEVLARSVMSLYVAATARIIVDSEMTEEVQVTEGKH